VERDHAIGPDEAEAHHRHERGAARDDARLAAVAAEDVEGLGQALGHRELEGMQAHGG